ncbi:unnamed protein product [Musa textilis]
MQSNKLFPTGFYIFILMQRIIFLDHYSSLIIFLTGGSVAMICFYSYVIISGENPPHKKLAAAPNNCFTSIIVLRVELSCYIFGASRDSLGDCTQNTQLYENLCHKDPLCKLIMELWEKI